MLLASGDLDIDVDMDMDTDMILLLMMLLLIIVFIGRAQGHPPAYDLLLEYCTIHGLTCLHQEVVNAITNMWINQPTKLLIWSDTSYS